ncbi:MAG: Kazal-type serine protease inhibitor domain-containing protein [Polyangiales bacterium]
MNFSPWTTSGTRSGSPSARALRIASLAFLGAALTGCPLEDNPDSGPPRGDGGMACTAEYAPVCGVDGVTYGNACTANAHGVLVSHYGPCEDQVVRCGGVYGDTCSPYEYCDYGTDAGVADLIAPPMFDGGTMPPPPPSGVCRPREVTYCTDDSGCPSDQYCQLSGTGIDLPVPTPGGDVPEFIPAPIDAGIIIAVDAGGPRDAAVSHTDAGAPPLGICQPREVRYCYSVDDPICREGEYCDLSDVAIDFAPPEPGNPGADPALPIIAPPPGVCRPDVDPPGCPDIDDFVCATNGITYQNACVAESMNATVAYPGRCVPGGQRSCGGWVGDTCADDEYCYFEPATYCDYADASGVCAPRPEACTQEYAPVCGCNGVTYGNACDAAGNGTSVATYGPCQTDPAPGGEGADCGGIAGLGCNAGLFCNYPPDAMCGAADQLGVCTVPPQACPDIWAPVCGCNGQIYGNDCEAAAAGMSVGPTSNCRNMTP